MNTISEWLAPVLPWVLGALVIFVLLWWLDRSYQKAEKEQEACE